MTSAEIRLAAAGRAYQSVTQSAAIAIQDGTDYLRNVSTISTTSIGVAMALLVAGDPKGNASKIIQAAQGIATAAVQQFTQISTAAVQVATTFPESFG
ncbi:MAG: uncharacterized protein JWQ42_4513 [Edaphobacter sp.]|jgi:uncharacterized 2Fe-2S/4Fe-4S cluster protein (DUF4445 family)|nr:uncharacterized protein [Edaphobacter sp.]